VVAAPTGFGFIWFAIVGGTGIELQRTGRADLLASVATPELSLFTALDALPLATITSAVCVFLIALFFVSGADAASIVMATMATRGSLHPPKIVVLVLGVLMGGIACAMLLVGGLSALQQAAVLGSVPFTFVIVGVAWCWITALRDEVVPPRAPSPAQPAVSAAHSDDGADAPSGDGVRVAGPDRRSEGER
jgi:choline-glycine betaine transporter